MHKGTILYIGGFEMPDLNAAAHRVLGIGKLCRELGYQVVYIGISHSETKLCKAVHQGFDCWAVPYPNSTLDWMKFLVDVSTLVEVAKKYENIQAVFFYNYQAIALYRALRICKKQGWRAVADATEWYLTEPGNPIYYLIKSADTCLRMCFLHPRLDGVIAISTYLKDYYAKKGCNVLQLPPLVDCSQEKWNAPLTEREGRDDRIHLVFAGTASSQKDNFSLLLQTMANFQASFTLELIGDFASSDAGALPAVTFHGKLSHARCIEIIRQADFQIFLREDNLVTRAGFPTKLVESFACGTPVITNLTSNIGDYLEDGRNAVIVPEVSQESLQQVLSRVQDMSREQIWGMKQHCKNTRVFDYHSQVDQFQNFMETM